MKRIDRGDSAGEKGFTLIEILIALALMSLVTTAIYSFYISQYKTWISQDLITEMQQNGRVAIDTISRDLLQTGYGTTVAIEEGTQNSIAVLYKDPDPTVNKYTRVMYWKSPQNELKRYEKNEATEADLGTINWSADGTTLAEDVTGLEFAYFDKNGNKTVTPGTSPNDPYRVKITIKLQASRDDPLKPGTRKHFTLSTDIRPRNIGIAGITSDTNAPAAPTGLQVVDPGLCGTLWVKWAPNTEADLASYTIYYGQATGVYTATVSVSKTSMDNNPVGEYYALTGLTTSKSNGTSTVKYYIKVVASDTSGNDSDINLSTEVGNDPNADPAVRSTNIRMFGAGNDTTVDIPKPSGPVGFKGVDIADENQVRLTWDASADPNVIGYRLYRRESAFGTFPVCATLLAPADCAGIQVNTVRVADESIIGAAATSFTDMNAADSLSDVATLLGCRTYYYALAPVTCDATLITDDAGDDNAKRYIQSDYAITFGDGVGGIADSPSGSDTSPADNVAPGAPTVNGRAGWRRVAMSETNPTDTDFAMTCLYVEKGGAIGSPVLDSTKDANGCFNVVDFDVNLKRLIPDASPLTNPDGIFTNTSPVTFWHDSMTVRAPAAPDLAQAGNEVQTYRYKAVSFDMCGNPRTIAAATSATTSATTNLCGEDPPSGEKPPAPGTAAVPAAVCSAAATISWTPVSSDVALPSTSTNPWDLAGYRIFKSSSTDFASTTLMNPAAPFWCEGTCSYPDDLVSEGGTYYYKIASTDCPYEKINPSEATLISDMNSSIIKSTATIGPVTPGMIDRDGGAVAVVTDHLEILTLDSRGDVASDPTMGYHNRVKLYLRNTSAGVMTITGIPDIRWGNTSARLAKVLIGGFEYAGNNNTTTQRTVWEAGSAAQLLGTCTTTPSDLCTASVTFSTPMEVGASDLHVPIIFEFRDVAYAVNENADMAGDSVFRMTLDVKNNSTNTTGCETYLTPNRQDAPITVPTGPVISGTAQNRTVTDYSSSSTVPGYWYLGASINVNVITNISDTSGTGISSVKLYYAVTERTVTSAPTLFADYTPITMNLVSGQYKTSSPIPANINKRVWYYIIAKDSQGNFDRQPEIQNGFYTYDHQPGTPCSVTPKNPTVLLGTPDAINNSVALSWTAATQYTSEENKYSSDEFKYRIYRRDIFGGSWNPVTDVSSTNYTDSGLDLNLNNYSYYVKTINKCISTTPACTGYTPWPASPPSCISTESNTYTECVGGGANVLNVDKTSIYGGNSFTITVGICSKANDEVSGEVISVRVNTVNGEYDGGDDIPMTESGDTGTFSRTVPTTTDPALNTSTTLLVNRTAQTDTITVDPSGTYGGPKTIAVSTDPCSNTPAAPTGLAVSGSPTCASDRKLNLTWSANAETDVIGYDVYQITPAGVATAVCSTNSRTATSCTDINTSDGAKLNSKLYQWVVKAKDSCTTPNISPASNTLSDPCP